MSAQLPLPGLANTLRPVVDYVAVGNRVLRRETMREARLLAQGGSIRERRVTIECVHATGEAAKADALSRNLGAR